MKVLTTRSILDDGGTEHWSNQMTQENSNPTDNGKTDVKAQANHWNWLQERMESTSVLDKWIDDELQVLEDDFADLVTQGSLARSLRRDR
jgi:hypothetical protein